MLLEAYAACCFQLASVFLLVKSALKSDINHTWRGTLAPLN